MSIDTMRDYLPDQGRFFPLIKRMYDRGDTGEIGGFCTEVQLKAFKNELDALERFGLHKKIEIHEKPEPDKRPARGLLADGKVQTLISVSSAGTREDYYNARGKRVHRKLIRNSFITSYMVKSRKVSSDDAPPICMNCGAPLLRQGDLLICNHCKSRYRTEAYDYILSHIEFQSAFRGFKKFGLILILLFVLTIMYRMGFLSFLEPIVNEWNSLTPEELPGSPLYWALMTLVGGVILALGFFIGSKAIRHFVALGKVRSGDPDFSLELFKLRVMDVLKGRPDLLRPSDEEEIICRNLQDLVLTGYQVTNGDEELDFICKVEGLRLSGSRADPHVREALIKKSFRAIRRLGVKTPVHYQADLYVCPSCGGHSFKECGGVQTCEYCGEELDMKELDWVIDPVL